MEKIKLPRSSYEELAKIITAYGSLNRPATLHDIAQSTGMNKTAVSANNAFLSFIEIVDGGNKKSATAKGSSLSRALEHEMTEQIREAWAQIIVENDFLSKMIQAVKIRRGMEVSQFENHIAYSSGEVKSSGVMTGARAVVDILLHSGKLRQEGDKLVADGSPTNYQNTETKREDQEGEEKPLYTEAKQTSILSKSGDVNVNIELTITATPNDLPGLGIKIKSLLDEIRGAE